MRNERAAPETKGVTVKLLAALDLGPEIEGMAGRQFRMRMVPRNSSTSFLVGEKNGRA